MEFIRNIDLNRICRILDSVAVVGFVFGFIASLILGIHEEKALYDKDLVIEWPIIIIGIALSALDSMFLLFLSRVGDAIDDIRNKYLGYDVLEEVEE